MAVYNYINNTGVITVDAAAIQQDVENEYKAVFGADLIVTPNTPQGLLISAEVLARIALAENNAQLANQINPNLAGGVFLDSVMALTNPYNRQPALQSIVFATLAGTPGTVIPAGSIVSETGSGDANEFYTLVDVTIPAGGSATNVQFNSVEYGPIPCATGLLTVIVTAVLGWTGVSNSTAAVLGRLAQSDLDARLYRLNTLATQGASTAQAITSELLRLSNVSSVTFLENTANTTTTISGVSMAPHSIYVCVDDTVAADLGTPSEVAATITGIPAVVQTGVLNSTVNVTGLSDTSLLTIGWSVTGTGIPSGTTIAALPTGTTLTLSQAATVSSSQSLSFNYIIPAGSQASTTDGYVFQTLANVSIPASGTLSPVIFQAIQTGPIPVPIGSLTTIVTPVTGWTTVNNTIAGAIGLSSPIAQAIVAKKSAGAAFNNGSGTNVSTVVDVPYSGQLMTVLFDVAEQVAISVIVTVKVLTSIQDAETATKNAIIAYATGNIDGIAGLTIGQAVSAFELAGAVTSQYPSIYVQNLYIARSPTAPTSSAELPMAVYEIATIALGGITVNVV